MVVPGWGAACAPSFFVLRFSAAVDAVVPRDAEGAGLDGYFHQVTDVESVEVVGVYGQALVGLTWAPTTNRQAARAAYQSLHIKAADNCGGVIGDIFYVVEAAVDEQRGGENPRKRDESRVDALEDFNFFAIASATLKRDGEEERGEENHAEEDQHQVDVERRVDLADIGERQRAEQEDRGAGHQVAAEHHLRGSGGQATRGALIGGSFGTAVQATGHR
jgi:hypothetical protein